MRVSGRTSVRYRFGSPFSSKRLWFVDTVLWLCPSLPTETLKRLSSLPILMQESFWWWQCSDRYIISFFPAPSVPPPPFSPSLISFVVSVDVKHHVYLLTEYYRQRKKRASERASERERERGGGQGGRRLGGERKQGEKWEKKGTLISWTRCLIQLEWGRQLRIQPHHCTAIGRVPCLLCSYIHFSLSRVSRRTLDPFSPSLISRTVSVDVRHHVYLLTWNQNRT